MFSRDHVHLGVDDSAEAIDFGIAGSVEGSDVDEDVSTSFGSSKKKPYWGNHFWAKGYCVDTVGLDADMIRKYVRYQEEKEKQLEQLQLC